MLVRLDEDLSAEETVMVMVVYLVALLYVG